MCCQAVVYVMRGKGFVQQFKKGRLLKSYESALYRLAGVGEEQGSRQQHTTRAPAAAWQGGGATRTEVVVGVDAAVRRDAHRPVRDVHGAVGRRVELQQRAGGGLGVIAAAADGCGGSEGGEGR